MINIIKNYYENLYTEKKIVYKYIPRTYEQERSNPYFITDIFKQMFSQPSPWIKSTREYDVRKQDKINNYFISQL